MCKVPDLFTIFFDFFSIDFEEKVVYFELSKPLAPKLFNVGDCPSDMLHTLSRTTTTLKMSSMECIVWTLELNYCISKILTVV